MRIAIIGSPGAGKTRLAKDLHQELGIPVFHLDRMFWGRNWEQKDRDSRIDILQQIVQRKQWIIEGTYLRSSEVRLDEADTVIFLDTSAIVCLLRIIKRHRKEYGRFRRDIPEGCTDKLTWQRMWKVLAFPLGERRELENILCEFPREKVIQLHSVKEIKAFLVQPELYIQEMRLLAKPPAILKQNLRPNFRHFLTSTLSFLTQPHAATMAPTQSVE